MELGNHKVPATSRRPLAMPKRSSSRLVAPWLVLLFLACGEAPAVERQEPLPARIEEHILAGRQGEAQTLLREAQQVYRARHDRQGEAACSLLLAVSAIRAADLSAAAADLAQGGALLAALGDPLGTWAAEWLQGGVHAGAGRFASALGHFETSLAALQAARDRQGRPDFRTLKLIRRSLLLSEDVLAEPKILSILEAMSRDGSISVLVLSKQFPHAEAEISRLAAVSRRLNGRFESLVAAHRGGLRLHQGHLAEARDNLRNALAGASSLPPSPFRDERPELQILEQLTEIDLQAGRCTEALAWNDQALEVLRRHGEERTLPAAVLVRVERARVFDGCNDLAQAESVLSEALVIARQGGSVYLQATTETQIGRLLAETARRFEEAARHLEAAVGLFQEIKAPLDEVKAWLLLSESYANLEAFDNAAVAQQRARDLVRAAGGEPWLEAILDKLAASLQTRIELAQVKASGQNLERLLQILEELRADLAKEGMTFPFLGPFLEGYLLFQRGQPAEARALWAAALADAPTPELEAQLLAAIGVTYWREEKVEQALPYFERAAGCFETAIADVRTGELLAGFLGGHRQGFFQALVEMLAAKNRPREAFDFAERARARAFLLDLGGHRLRPHHGADARLVKESEDLRLQTLALEQQARSAPSPQLRKARQQYEQLLVRLKVKSGEYASLTRAEPLDVEAVQEALPAAATMISFFVSADRVHAWVIDRASFHYVALPFGPEDHRRAACWEREVGHHRGATQVVMPQCENANPGELYEKLIAPLAAKIRHPKLILVPHGELHYLPFAALRNPRTGHFLIEDYTLIYAPSASTLRFLRAKETPVLGTSLVLGAPERQEPDLKPLHGMAREATAVARLLRESPRLGGQATESRLYGLDANPDLLHIAAHALYDPASPLFSRIALGADNGQDGNLEVHEILTGLDLTGANLVVLSACETARGERSGGDEITSLTRAFLYAGSPAVLSTLWKIDDAASTILMESFYRRLLAGAPAAEALRRAQIDLLHNPAYTDPYYWAAFSLAGDPQGRWNEEVNP